MTKIEFDTLRKIHNAVSISHGLVQMDRLHPHMQTIVSMWVENGYLTRTYVDETYFNSFSETFSVFELSVQAKVDYAAERNRRGGVITT